MSRIISTVSITSATLTTTQKRVATRIIIDNDPLNGLSAVFEYSDLTIQTTTLTDGSAANEIIDIRPVEAVRVPGDRVAGLPCFAATQADLKTLADQVSEDKWPKLGE